MIDAKLLPGLDSLVMGLRGLLIGIELKIQKHQSGTRGRNYHRDLDRLLDKREEIIIRLSRAENFRQWVNQS